METKNKELTISDSGAQDREGIDVGEKAVVTTPHTGEEKGFAAESRDKEAEFEMLISGEYKKEFADRVKKIIGRRLKEVKSVKETEKKNAQIVEALMKKFNIEDGDTERLERMIDTHMTQENKNDAQEKTIELIKKLARENSYLKKSRMEDMHRIKVQSQAQKLKEQAEETKKAYSEFDFEEELKNPEFCRLLRVGVSVKNAYEVVNIDSILKSNSKNAEKMVVDSIRSKQARPVENGSDSTGGIILSSNVSKLNKKQRAELAKRAAKGERISL